MYKLKLSQKTLRQVEKSFVRAKISDKHIKYLAKSLASLLEAIERLDELEIGELEPAVVYVAGEK